MTYAKRKAATPATAATAKEPVTLDAAPVNWVGVAVADGEVTFLGTGIEALAEGAGAGLVVGATVTVERMTVGTQVLMVMTETGADEAGPLGVFEAGVEAPAEVALETGIDVFT